MEKNRIWQDRGTTKLLPFSDKLHGTPVHSVHYASDKLFIQNLVIQFQIDLLYLQLQKL